MTNERINILIASDINYAPYYGVMMTSLFLNNKESKFDIHLLTDSTWKEIETKRFESLVAKYNSTFHVYVVDEKQLEKFPLRGHLTLPTYYNLCASSLLPESIHRIIYMDGDMIVNGDILPLWELDLKEYVCAQVLGGSYCDKSIYDRLGYDEKYGYYNNGVVLYDFDKLRKMDFSNKAMQYITDNPEKVTWLDQDTMNALLYDKTLRLPFRYNFQTVALTKRYWKYYDEKFRLYVLEESKSPVVVHYAGNVKPWTLQYWGLPYGNMWNKYYRNSVWKEAIQYKKMSMKYFKYLLKRIFRSSIFRQRCKQEYIDQAWVLR